MAHRARKKRTEKRPYIVQVSFLNFSGKSLEAVFREGYERAHEGSSLMTTVRFFDKNSRISTMVSTHAYILLRHENMARLLADAVAAKAAKERIRRLGAELKTFVKSLDDSRARIHATVVREFDRVIYERNLIAIEDSLTKRIAIVTDEATLDLASMAKLARQVYVEIFSPSHLLCERSDLKMLAAMD